MATSTRASRALLFQAHCRHTSPRQQSIHLTSRRHASTSQYAPSNFTRQFPSERKEATSSTTASKSHTLGSPRPSYAYPRATRPLPMEIPGTKLTFWTWVKMLFGHRPRPAFKPAPFHINNNPYRARKKWPPDFRELDAKQQFHFEKTYRRRAALKWARPTWNKSIKILQHTLITFTIIYFVFILEPTHGQGTPFDGFRVWFFDKLSNLGQLPASTREEAGKLSVEARSKMKKPDNEQVDASPTASA